tara:strand:+ start:3081 stop:3653 length:573 start_codon:yes stop_codon:yes gene_type:complete
MIKKRTPKVRIVGGKFRGSNIPFDFSSRLRPTSNKTREILFNWLMHDVTNANCLDLFSGTGALGIEAISRGAKSVFFIEEDKMLYKQLHLNLKKLNALKQTKIMNGDALKIPLKASNETKYDIIFLDPPFKKNILKRTYNKLMEEDLIYKETLIYVEAEKDLQIEKVFEKWKMLKSKITDQTNFGLFKLK